MQFFSRLSRVARRWLIGCVGVLLLVILWQVWQRWPQQQTDINFGAMRVYPAWFWQRGFMYLFSDVVGVTDADRSAAQRMALSGYRVTLIDSRKFLVQQQRANAGCIYMPGMLEAYSDIQQRKEATGRYQEPWVLGHGIGGTLAYMTQLQAPPLAFAGVVAIDPVAQLHVVRTFCDHAAEVTTTALSIKPEPPNDTAPFKLLLSANATDATRQFVLDIHSNTQSAAGTLYDGYRQALTAIAADQLKGGVTDLPLAEVMPDKMTTDDFAILYSGDGGWRDLDQTLAGVLADKGMPVVGVDVLRYYWNTKSPKVAALDLARVIRHYQTVWHRNQVVLIGFSFGANVMPFLYNRLPVELRRDVRLVTLLSPEQATVFTVGTTSWFGNWLGKIGWKTADSLTAIAPELSTMLHAGARVQCIYGEEEADDSLCTLPAAKAARVIRKPGGHHFDENYEQLADDLLQANATPDAVDALASH